MVVSYNKNKQKMQADASPKKSGYFKRINLFDSFPPPPLNSALMNDWKYIYQTKRKNIHTHYFRFTYDKSIHIAK